MEQTLVFATIGLALVLFAWGRFRHDVVAMFSLLVLVLAGIVDPGEAFEGFANPAVVSVAAVLVVGHALERTGFVELIGHALLRAGRGLTLQILLLCLLVCIASAFMNNIGALALFMPVAVHITRKAGHPPSYVLMPLAFSSLLGGLITMIGTPSNLIVAGYRRGAAGAAFGIFDFAPVGAGVAVAGIAFLVLVGWRLLPRRDARKPADRRFGIDSYLTEVAIPETSPLVGTPVVDLGPMTESRVRVAAVVREVGPGTEEPVGAAPSHYFGRGHTPLRPRKRILSPNEELTAEAGDVLVLEADTESLGDLMLKTKCRFAGDENPTDPDDRRTNLSTVEAVVLPDSPVARRTAAGVHLRARFGLNLLAVARRDVRRGQRLRSVVLQAGDVLLLRGPADVLDERIAAMGCIPLADRELVLERPGTIVPTLAIFAVSVVLVVTGLLPIHISFVLAALVMVVAGVLPFEELYRGIDWPVVVMLGAMLPIGVALEETGGVDTIVGIMMRPAGGLSAPVLMGVTLVITMLLSAVINNAATVVLMAPVGIGIALRLDVSVDPFLMAIAVGAACSFLTPVAHQSNTLVMGPGGYRFIDYVRVGLPLSIVSAAVAVPLIGIVWPF